jgi:hypothetical protein
MGRPPGQPKTGGKQKGFRDRYSVQHFRKTLKELGVDPFSDLVKLIPNLPLTQQATVLQAVLSYVSRRPTPMEMPGDHPEAGKRNPMSKLTTESLLEALQDNHEEKRTEVNVNAAEDQE